MGKIIEKLNEGGGTKVYCENPDCPNFHKLLVTMYLTEFLVTCPKCKKIYGTHDKFNTLYQQIKQNRKKE